MCAKKKIKRRPFAVSQVKEGVVGYVSGWGRIQEEAEDLPDATAMPEGAEYRREQKLERERREAGGGGGDCCLGERSGEAGAPAWGSRAGIKERSHRRNES